MPLCLSQIQNRRLWDQTLVSVMIRRLYTIGATALLRVLRVQRADYLRALYCVLLRFKNRCTKYVKHPHTNKHTQNCLTLPLYTVPSVWYICSYIPLEMFPHITEHTCVIVTGTTKMKPGSRIIQF